jgi:putative transposase
MPRKPRDEVGGAVQHVYARGNAKQLIYLDDVDRSRYLALLAQAVRRYRWRCLAFCLMDNHVHLLLETPLPNLGSGMQRTHGLYAQSFNRRHGRSGHLFQGRFGSVLVTSHAQLLMTVRYIARNPVEACLCEEAAQWPWSSHGALLTSTWPAWLDAARLLGYLGADGGDPLRRYEHLVGWTEPRALAHAA